MSRGATAGSITFRSGSFLSDGIGRVFTTQVQLFVDEPSLPPCFVFEKAVYDSLG